MKNMTNIARRIEKIEKQLLPAPETACSREFLERIKAGRRRVEEYYKLHGLSLPSDEGLPTPKIHTSHGIRRIMDILNEGRDRARLRSLMDGKLQQSDRLATGDASAGTPTSTVLDPPIDDSPKSD